MYIEGIDTKNIKFGEPIKEREPNYHDGYIRGIYRARNIIDNKVKTIEKLGKEIEYLSNQLEIANNKLNMIKDNVQILTRDELLEIIENYTGFFGKESD